MKETWSGPGGGNFRPLSLMHRWKPHLFCWAPFVVDIVDPEVPKTFEWKIFSGNLKSQTVFFLRWLPSGYLNVTEGEMLEVRFVESLPEVSSVNGRA